MYTDRGGRLLAAAFVYVLMAGVCGFVLLKVEMDQGWGLLLTALGAAFATAALDRLNDLIDCTNAETDND